jgi:hypothetical protein
LIASGVEWSSSSLSLLGHPVEEIVTLAEGMFGSV